MKKEMNHLAPEIGETRQPSLSELTAYCDHHRLAPLRSNVSKEFRYDSQSLDRLKSLCERKNHSKEDPAETSFHEAARQSIYEDHCFDSMQPHTLNSYLSAYRNNCQGTDFDSMNMLDIQPIDIARFLDGLKTDSTRKRLKTFISKVFANAAEKGIVTSDPSTEVSIRDGGTVLIGESTIDEYECLGHPLESQPVAKDLSEKKCAGENETASDKDAIEGHDGQEDIEDMNQEDDTSLSCLSFEDDIKGHEGPADIDDIDRHESPADADDIEDLPNDMSEGKTDGDVMDEGKTADMSADRLADMLVSRIEQRLPDIIENVMSGMEDDRDKGHADGEDKSIIFRVESTLTNDFSKAQDMSEALLEEAQKGGKKYVYLVDLENVHEIDWLPEFVGDADAKNYRIILFYNGQSRISMRTYQKLSHYNVEFIEVEVPIENKNALDFQLVSYIGYMIHEYQSSGESNVEYYIVSKDNGYYAVCQFWKKRMGIEIDMLRRTDNGELFIEDGSSTVTVKRKPKAQIKPVFRISGSDISEDGHECSGNYITESGFIEPKGKNANIQKTFQIENKDIPKEDMEIILEGISQDYQRSTITAYIRNHMMKEKANKYIGVVEPYLSHLEY